MANEPNPPTTQEPSIGRTKTISKYYTFKSDDVFGVYSFSDTNFIKPIDSINYTTDCPIAPVCDNVVVEQEFPIELTWIKNLCCDGPVTITSEAPFIFNPPLPYTTNNGIYSGTVRFDICDPSVLEQYTFKIIGCDSNTEVASYLVLPNIDNARDVAARYFTSSGLSYSSCRSCCPPCPPVICPDCGIGQDPNVDDTINISIVDVTYICGANEYIVNLSFPVPCPDNQYTYNISVFEVINGVLVIYQNIQNSVCGPVQLQLSFNQQYYIVFYKINILTFETEAVTTLPYYIQDPFNSACEATITDDYCNEGNTGSINLINLDTNIDYIINWSRWNGIVWENLPGTLNNRQIRNLNAGTYRAEIQVALPTLPVTFCTQECEFIVRGSTIDVTITPVYDCEVPYVDILIIGGNRDCLECGEGIKYSLDNGPQIMVPLDGRIILKNIENGPHTLQIQDCHCCAISRVFNIRNQEIKQW